MLLVNGDVSDVNVRWSSSVLTNCYFKCKIKDSIDDGSTNAKM